MDYPISILFAFTMVGIGAILRMFLKKWTNFVSIFKYGSLMKLPYTVFIMMMGLTFGTIAGVTYRPYLLGDINPELIISFFLPVVIFNAAYVIDIHVFWRSIGHITLLAIPGLLITTFLTGFLSFIIPDIASIASFEVRLYIALLFGAIISATNPVSVVALLKDLGNQNLATIIEGEALIKNGLAVVLFKIFLDMLIATLPSTPDMTAFGTIELLMRQLFLGFLLGYLMAKLAGFTLENIYNDAVAEITITVSFTFLTDYICALAQTSGTFAIVVFGLALDRASITPQVDHFLHRFWELLAFLSNTLIFVIVGVQISIFIQSMSWYDGIYLLLIYVGMMVIRAFSIFCFFPVMTRLGIELSWRQVFVMTWGGLRGAVALTLAIYLNSMFIPISDLETDIGLNESSFADAYGMSMNETTTAVYESVSFEASTSVVDLLDIAQLSTGQSYVINRELKRALQKVLLHTGGIVLLTLIINASTIEAVMEKLGMLEVTTAQQLVMQNAVKRIQQDIKRSAGVLRFDRFLADAKWTIVEDETTILYPYKELPQSGAVAAGLTEFGKNNAGDEVQMTVSQDDTLKSLFDEARLRHIKALKMSYWQQYSNGMVTDRVFRNLIIAANAATDKPGEVIDINDIRKCWMVEGFWPWIKSKLEDLWNRRGTDNMVPPGPSPQIQYLFRIVHSDKFEILMQVIIVMNVIPIIMDFAVDKTWESSDAWLLGLQITNYVFIVIYCGEAGAKLIGLGIKQYFSDKWNWFDIFVLIICLIEIIIDMVLVDATAASASLVKTIEKALRILRTARLLRLSKTLIPKTINFINKQINKRLRFGYGVGKGFVTAEEDVRKFIVSISDNKAIQQKLMRASNKNRLTVIKEMGLLQRDHPGIAISVKTRMAIRSLLNQTKDTIYQLCAGGILDEVETQILEQGVDTKLNSQSNFPSVIPPPPPEDLLENIPWLIDDEESRDFIKTHSIIKDFVCGDIIMREGGEVDGVHIIISGMIRLYGGLYGQTQLFNIHSSDKKEREETTDENLNNQEDFLCSGNIVGELGLLTKSVRSCSVSCETDVQTFFVSAEDMEEAFSRFPALKKAMWSVVANRISVPLFLDHIKYQGTAVEKIHLLISSGYIIELTEEDSMFRFTDRIDEVCIVHGTVTSTETREILKAPFLALPEHEVIKLHHCSLSVLLVIPRDLGIDVFTDSRSMLIHNSQVASLACLSGMIGALPSHDLTEI